MNDVIKVLKERRSVRKFKGDMPPKDLVDEVIEAGLYAPSGKGQQSAIVIAVTNKDVREQLCKDNAKIGGRQDDFDPFYGAPVILIVLGKKDWPTHVYDGSLVMGNLLNAAQAVGLGSLWVHRAKEEFEMPEYKQLLLDLGIDGEWEGIGHCALGYADGPVAEAVPRKDSRVYRIE